MIEMFGVFIVPFGIAVVIFLMLNSSMGSFFGKFGSAHDTQKSIDDSLALAEEAMDGALKNNAIAEKNLALNQQRVTQGEETIALLKAIKENLEYRTPKN